jgi:hypothetical protein
MGLASAVVSLRQDPNPSPACVVFGEVQAAGVATA